MATARDIVEDAFREIGVVADDEPMTASQATNGVNALNRMMHAWLLEGIDVGHADLELGDVFPLEAQYVEGTIYLLAERLGPKYSAPISFDPDDFKRKLAAAYLNIPDSKLDSTLTRRRTWWTQ